MVSKYILPPFQNAVSTMMFTETKIQLNLLDSGYIFLLNKKFDGWKVETENHKHLKNTKRKLVDKI